MKLLKSILILSLIMCVCVCAYAQDGEVIPLMGTPETYDIGVEKDITITNTFVIKYINNMMGNKEVKLEGSIEVNRRYQIIDLQIDYYLLDGNQKTARATNLNLLPVEGSPGVFSFKYQYPLNLTSYEYEIFSLVFIVQEIDTQSI